MALNFILMLWNNVNLHSGITGDALIFKDYKYNIDIK
jgi:hypothetical protein